MCIDAKKSQDVDQSKEKRTALQNLCVFNSLLGLMKVGRTFDNHCLLHEVDDSVVTLHP